MRQANFFAERMPFVLCFRPLLCFRIALPPPQGANRLGPADPAIAFLDNKVFTSLHDDEVLRRDIGDISAPICDICIQYVDERASRPSRNPSPS